MRVLLSSGRWIKISFTKYQVEQIYKTAYRAAIIAGKVIKWDIEHPVRNLGADKQIGFKHPEYWKTRDWYTFAHKVDLAVYLKGSRPGKVRIDIWETDPRPSTETVGQLICYKKWLEREHPEAEEIRMNYVVYQKDSEIDKIAYDLGIFTWIVAFEGNKIVKLETYETTEW